MPFDLNLAIIFGTLLAALVVSLLYAFWYQSFKMKHKSNRRVEGLHPDKTIGISELEQIVRTAVAESTSSLDRRLANLEDEVKSLNAMLESDSRSLPEHIAGSLAEGDQAQEMDYAADFRRRSR